MTRGKKNLRDKKSKPSNNATNSGEYLQFQKSFGSFSSTNSLDEFITSTPSRQTRPALSINTASNDDFKFHDLCRELYQLNVKKQVILNIIEEKMQVNKTNLSLNQSNDELNKSQSFIRSYPILFGSKFNEMKLILRGKLSNIYICQHRFNEGTFIVKEGKRVNNSERLSESSLEMLNETRMLKFVSNHPHFIGMVDSWIDGSQYYLQLEYVPGGSLLDFLWGNYNQDVASNDTGIGKLCNSLSTISGWKLLAHIGSALGYLHNIHKIVHGDVKPSNILCWMRNCDKYDVHQQLSSSATDVEFKLTDLGRSTLSTDELIDGDGRYLAPFFDECPANEQPTAGLLRDIYALGVTLYHSTGVELTSTICDNIRNNLWNEWGIAVTHEMKMIISSMCHADYRFRFSAIDVLNYPSVRQYVLDHSMALLPSLMDL